MKHWHRALGLSLVVLSAALLLISSAGGPAMTGGFFGAPEGGRDSLSLSALFSFIIGVTIMHLGVASPNVSSANLADRLRNGFRAVSERTRRALLIGGLASAALTSPGDAQTARFSPSLGVTTNTEFVTRSVPRSRTEYIILHQTTADGNSRNQASTIAHQHLAHYFIDKKGVVYPLVNENQLATHAGHSMWNGKRELSPYSIGIEVEGSEVREPTAAQYASLKKLVKKLQSKYHLPDSHVLGHYQVACCRVNHYVPKPNQRGGRFDAVLFDWDKIGVKHSDFDPDVAAHRLILNPQHGARLKEAGIDLRSGPSKQQDARARAQTEEKEKPSKGKGLFGKKGVPPISRPIFAPQKRHTLENVITAQRTPYSIAGDAYDDPTTIYLLNGSPVSGDKISDWEHLPAGTRIYLHSSVAAVKNVNTPAVRFEKGSTPWSLLGSMYDDAQTRYVFPGNSHTVAGTDLDEPIAIGTIAVTNVAHLEHFKKSKAASALPKKYHDHAVTYVLPDHTIKTGDKLDPKATLPANTYVFFRK